MSKVKKRPLKTLLFAAFLCISTTTAAYASPPPSPAPFDYTIRKGDTMYLLALRFNSTVDKIASSNPQASPDNLMVKSKLKITPGGGIVLHPVAKGDTLWKIAERYQSSVDAIAAKNHIENPDLIFEGDILAIADPADQKEIMRLSGQVVNYIKNRDYSSLSKVAHPEKWIRFSPYVHVNIHSDVVFWPPTISKFSSSKTKYEWGAYDGTGEPIYLTPSQYFDRFVYNRDFAAADKVSFNRVMGKGNSLENQFEVYPRAGIVEYYVRGTEKYGYMDWQSLRLVFEKYNGKWYLTGIIHNEWTI